MQAKESRYANDSKNVHWVSSNSFMGPSESHTFTWVNQFINSGAVVFDYKIENIYRGAELGLNRLDFSLLPSPSTSLPRYGFYLQT